ncbi:MAG: hypothetical protein KJO53_06080 [Eudoraea sp.]|nr:hypothetical protein [Eudoraea sp.]
MFRRKYFIPIAFIFGLICILFVWFGNPNSVYTLTREDGFIENLTALFYFIGFIISVISINKREKVFLPILWVILCFVFLGEETSWFQRIFNYNVEAVESINAQGEFNLHNLKVFQGENSSGLFVDGKIKEDGLKGFFRTTQNWFRLGFFGYFVILPLIIINKKIKNLLQKIGYKPPNFKFIIAIIIVFLLSFVLAIFSPENIKSSMAETREMLYSAFILTYILVYIWPLKKEKRLQ